MTWALAPDGRHLQRDGADDVLLADTWWAALHRAPHSEFEDALDLRAEQGFNAVMMSLLPISHDASGEVWHPFVGGEAGIRTGDLEDAWLRHAESMLALTTDRGLTPVVMIQWVNYVPGTWASRERPDLVMSDEATIAFLDRVVPALLPHRPIWSLSGDDTFLTEQSVERYELIHERLRRHDPTGLVTAHTGGFVSLPQRVLDLTDLVGFQSGHDGANWADNPASWNHYLDAIGAHCPRINLEPPYEGHGYDSGAGRYDARRVRTAAWRSVLSGAGAGMAYGAHGLWSWHREGDPFSSEGWSGMPFDAMTALRFPGANDMTRLRELVLEHRMWRLGDRSDLVVRDRSGIRVGGSRDLDLVVVHAPHAFSFEVQVDAGAYDVHGYDLEHATAVEVPVSTGPSGRLVVETPRECVEHLYVLERRGDARTGSSSGEPPPH